jgi:hypothetical protein
MQVKKQSIQKLLCGFPSMANMGETQTAALIATYLEVTSEFSSPEVFAACERLRKQPGAFPPSAGDLHAKCKEMRPSNDFAKRWDKIVSETPRVMGRNVLRLEHKREIHCTPEQLADWGYIVNEPGKPYQARVAANGDPLRIPSGYPGAGQIAEYGYLTPREAALKRNAPVVERTVPGSWLERWERENGRPYPHAEEVMRRALGDKQFRDAAE